MGHCIVRIDQPHDSRTRWGSGRPAGHRDSPSHPTARGSRGRWGRPGAPDSQRSQDLGTNQRVALHLGALLVAQGHRLHEDVFADPDLTHVVEHRLRPPIALHGVRLVLARQAREGQRRHPPRGRSGLASPDTLRRPHWPGRQSASWVASGAPGPMTIAGCAKLTLGKQLDGLERLSDEVRNAPASRPVTLSSRYARGQSQGCNREQGGLRRSAQCARDLQARPFRACRYRAAQPQAAAAGWRSARQHRYRTRQRDSRRADVARSSARVATSSSATTMDADPTVGGLAGTPPVSDLHRAHPGACARRCQWY